MFPEHDMARLAKQQVDRLKRGKPKNVRCRVPRAGERG